MTDTDIEQRADDEAMARGYYGILDDANLEQMSFVQLAALLSSCEIGSAKFSVVEREMKKHLAKDQAKINRSNIILGACIGLAGVFIGSFLRSSPACNEVAPTSAVQQLSNIKLPVAAIMPAKPAIATQAINPTPVGNNAQPSKPNP